MFVSNPNQNNHLSEKPIKAIVSIKVQRGTKYQYFIETLDQVKEAYYQLYGEELGITSDQFRALNRTIPSENEKYLFARSGLPMNISIADPGN